MIPRNQQNRKARIDLTCPICGMELSKGWASGFIRDGETYCCRGCAEGLVPILKRTRTPHPEERVGAFTCALSERLEGWQQARCGLPTKARRLLRADRDAALRTAPQGEVFLFLCSGALPTAASTGRRPCRAARNCRFRASAWFSRRRVG